MTRIEKLHAAAASLSEEQVDALIAFARSMNDKPFYDVAPDAARQSIDRGLIQINRGDTVTLEQLARRLATAAKRS